MKIGFYCSTPRSRLFEQMFIQATLAMVDAMRFGPIQFTRLN